MSTLVVEGGPLPWGCKLGDAAWWAGDLRCLGIIEGLQRVLEEEDTGRMVIRTDRATRSLYVEGGEYVGGTSDHKADRLGEVLWRAGRISLDQLMIAGESLEPGKRIGRVLVDLGYLEQKELRGALWQQARSVLEAACLETVGAVCFVRGQKSDNPIRWGVPTIQLLGETAAAFEEVEALTRRVEPLDAPCQPKIPAPSGLLDEPTEALLQLATSGRKKNYDRAALLARADLGTLDGLRALANLVEGGYFIEEERASEVVEEAEPRVRRLVKAVNLVMLQLKFAQGGPGEAVRGFLAEPPEHLEEVLSGISIDEDLEADAIELQAGFAEGGVERMERALVSLLDYALFEARDALDEEDVDRLDEEVASLDIFP
jgi:hypothetical protein